MYGTEACLTLSQRLRGKCGEQLQLTSTLLKCGFPMRVPSFHLLLFKLGNGKWRIQVICLKPLTRWSRTQPGLTWAAPCCLRCKPDAAETVKEQGRQRESCRDPRWWQKPRVLYTSVTWLCYVWAVTHRVFKLSALLYLPSCIMGVAVMIPPSQGYCED